MSKFKMSIMFLILTTMAWSVDIENANVSAVTAQRDLAGQVGDLAARTDGWISWEVPMIQTQEHHGDSGPCSFSLGRKHNYSSNWGNSQFITIWLEVRDGEVRDVLIISDACTVDGNGENIVQVTEVDPTASIDMLAGIINTGKKRARQGALTALVFHRDGYADEVMMAMIDVENPGKIVEQVAFWMGEARGRAGFDNLQQLALSSSVKVRHAVTFGLYSSDISQADEVLLDMARDDASDKVRGQALFWGAQKGNESFLTLIEDILAEPAGKKMIEKAIFALSQFPDDQGHDRLKALATNHEDERVRARALFWLGQENEAEALPIIMKLFEGNPGKAEIENGLLLLSQQSDGRGVPTLIDLARNHENPKLRGKALFWLSQTAADRISETMVDAVNDDPDLQVKEQAVFSLSQLPREEAIPQLTKLAREHKSPEIRKKAVFWLGQIGGSEAVDLMEEILEQ